MKFRKSAYYDIVIGILALIVVIITLLEFSVFLNEEIQTYLFFVNIIILSVFLVDFGLRLKETDDKKSFFKDPFNILDFIAIIPFELVIFAPQFTAFRGLRAARLIRLIRLFRAGVFIRKFYVNIKSFLVTNGFYKFILITFLTVVFGAIGIYFIEYQHMGGKGFEDALWWSVVTAFTVGYGDISPSSTYGRLVAVLLMFFGIGFLGMLTGTLATFFLDKTNKNNGNGLNDEQSIFIENSIINLENMNEEDFKLFKKILTIIWEEKTKNKK